MKKHRRMVGAALINRWAEYIWTSEDDGKGYGTRDRVGGAAVCVRLYRKGNKQLLGPWVTLFWISDTGFIPFESEDLLDLTLEEVSILKYRAEWEKYVG